MTVTVVDPGRTVRVTPDELDGRDILEFAETLLEEEGWSKTPQRGGGDTFTGPRTFHEAVNEAARRATDASGKGYGDSDEFRQAANALLALTHDQTDIQINDAADGVHTILAKSREAREA